ncbi:MAG TPA: DMT family transporter [Chitinophagaceae bacterium]|nr:DMT family transporter [Chitinophagaceae bacterium]
MTSTVKAQLAVLGTNLFFAANFSLVKYISPSYIKPFAVNIIRVGISALLFWSLWILVATFTKKPGAGIQKKDMPRFLLCGLTGVAINQMFFIKGITYTSPIHASLLILLTPLLITLFAYWVLKEKMTLVKVMGLTLGIGGSVLLILSKENSINAVNYLLGDMLIVVNAISYACYFILVKPLMQKYPPLHVVRWIFTFGFFMILPFGWSDFFSVQWENFRWIHSISLVAIVFAGTFLAYYFNVYGIQHLGAGVAGSFIYTQPIFAAVIAVIFMKEVLTIEKLLAGLLIFTGVYLVNFGKKSFNTGLRVIEE